MFIDPLISQRHPRGESEDLAGGAALVWVSVGATDNKITMISLRFNQITEVSISMW